MGWKEAGELRAAGGTVLQERVGEDTALQGGEWLIVEELTAAPFDLSADYMLRADVVEGGDGEWLLVVTVHHIAADGWSQSILVEELVELYDARQAGREAALRELPVQYG